jgi:pantothenate kinase
MKRLTRDSALERASLLQESSTRYILGIVGKPGVGKSTFTDFLREHLSQELFAILPMDGFHMSNEELLELGRRDRKGAPDTFDVTSFTQTLAAIKESNGADIKFPIFKREIEASIPDAGVIPAQAKLVIVEGNYLLHDQSGWEQVGGYLDESWYLQVDDEQRMQRLIARHIAFGKSPEDAKDWSKGTDEANARVIQESEAKADFVVTLR